MASSKTAKTTLKKQLKNSNEIDRISNLPDSILCFILSFLRTKESVQTCILSKRWKFLWTNVPCLDFQLYSGRDDKKEGFVKFVTMALLLHNFQSLKKFHLVFCGADPFNVTAWLRTAIARNVQVLEIGVFCNANNFIALPGSFFTSSSLTFLKLEGDLLVQVPSLVSLPRLECLNLSDVQFECDASVPKFIHGCPVLNSLDIERNRFDNVVVFTVTSPTLKHLEIKASFETDDVLKLEINAPVLEYLNLSDSVSKDLSVQSLPFLVELHLYELIEHCPQYDCDWFLKLVQALHRLKILTLGNIEYENFTEATAAQASEKFSSLTKLTVDSVCLDWKYLLILLDCSMHLEVLELNLYEYFRFSDAMFENHVPRCLSSSLQRISVTVFGERSEHEMIKYFLKHGGLLKRVELSTADPLEEDILGVKELKKLLTFSRKSKACEVHVFNEFDN